MNQIDRIKEEEANFIKFEDGDEKILYIDPGKMEIIANKWDVKKHQIKFMAVELTTPEQQSNPKEKEWTVSPTLAGELKEYLVEGKTLFKIKRKGKAANDTKYTITPQS